MTTTLAQAQRMGAGGAIALCHCFAGALEFQAGHWSTAEDALCKSIQLYREIGAASGEALACQRLGVLQTALPLPIYLRNLYFRYTHHPARHPGAEPRVEE